MSTPPTSHRAAILPEKGSPLSITPRQTPTPGPTEVLVKVHAIAINPVDHYQRDLGFPPIPHYPTVLGSDTAGTIVSLGSEVPPDTPRPGTRVVALASGFYKENRGDYGAFQEYVLTSPENLAVLPDSVSFEEAAILPLAVFTAWNGWCVAGLDHETKYTPANGEKRALLVWGGASSVGSVAVQIAKGMGFVVYVTASAKHHEYMKELGADRVFDYRDGDAVSQIIGAARGDGVTLRIAYDAVPGSLEPTLEVLGALKGEETARIAFAPPLPADAPTVEGIETKFVLPPMEPGALKERFFKTFRVWLSEKLASGEFVPSPRVQVAQGGLEGLNEALDVLKGGVSGTKIVLKL
ncbi:chaperonin 10-like protein [Aspergillus varians]